MPYKIENNTVMVYKGGKWHVLKSHETHAKALAHLRALQVNVPEAHGKNGKDKR
jgi:hypothetical protein